jgi:hypothetical protein
MIIHGSRKSHEKPNPLNLQSFTINLHPQKDNAMSRSHTLPRILVLASALLASYVSAKEGLWPSAITTGDCVSSRIETTKTAFNHEQDKQYCLGEKECTENTSKENTVTFFTDRCGLDQGDYFIGINGKEYKLKRISGDPKKEPYLTGKFSGDGFVVDIKSVKMIKKILQEGSKTDVEDAEYEVDVTISKGKLKQKVKAILWFGV